MERGWVEGTGGKRGGGGWGRAWRAFAGISGAALFIRGGDGRREREGRGGGGMEGRSGGGKRGGRRMGKGVARVFCN